MRHFIKLHLGRALDPEFNIICNSPGLTEDYPSLEMYSSICQLQKNEGSRARKKSFWIMKPYFSRVKMINGIKLVVNVLGGPNGCSIPYALSLKEFCEFAGSDFAFLQYLGSAVVNIESLAEGWPFRSILVAPRREVEDAIQNVQAEDYEPGVVLLGDSRDAFI